MPVTAVRCAAKPCTAPSALRACRRGPPNEGRRTLLLPKSASHAAQRRVAPASTATKTSRTTVVETSDSAFICQEYSRVSGASCCISSAAARRTRPSEPGAAGTWHSPRRCNQSGVLALLRANASFSKGVARAAFVHAPARPRARHSVRFDAECVTTQQSQLYPGVQPGALVHRLRAPSMHQLPRLQRAASEVRRRGRRAPRQARAPAKGARTGPVRCVHSAPLAVPLGLHRAHKRRHVRKVA